MISQAKTAESRAWFFPTSPRSPYKLQGELKLLKRLDGKIWNKQTQMKFAGFLRDSPDFDGNISLSDPAFSARNRATRAPRLLGFVHFPKKGTKGALHFTEVGNGFIDAGQHEQPLIFQRQLAKVQFKSPLHDYGGFKDMSVRPLMAMIKLLLELESMSKEEVALFAVTLTDHRIVAQRVKQVRQYRKDMSGLNARDKKIFRDEFAKNWIRKIYAQDIGSGRIFLREGGNDFVRKKYQTLRDYADSTIRYLRSTGLFTIAPHGQRLMLLNSNLEDAQFLLKTYGMALSEFSDLAYDAYIQRYLGNPSIPEIRKDNPAHQAQDMARMNGLLAHHVPGQARIYRQEYARAVSKMEKLAIISRLERQLSDIQVKNEAKEIRGDFEDSLNDIGKTYASIAGRQAEILDRPLMYEWNTWRAMVLINDAKNVQGNYTADADGHPVTTASGNKPDILVEYESFWLTVEVTLQSGRRQFETEGESIGRHLGILQKTRAEANDHRPVFGIFVAEIIHEEVINHLITQARYESQFYKGAIRILPLKRDIFETLMKAALHHPSFSHHILRRFFENIFTDTSLATGELDWIRSIHYQIRHFPTLRPRSHLAPPR